MNGRPDDEAYITRALQMSFTDDNRNYPTTTSSPTTIFPDVSIFNLVNFRGSLLGPQTSSPSPEVQGHVTGGLVSGGTGKTGTGRVSKRKPRPSKKRSQTTFIAVDPANFRQMVQQVTGIKVSGDWGGPPVVVKTAPQRPPGGFSALETSSFLLGHVLHQRPDEEVAPVNGPGGYNGLEAFSGFPTMDSWKVII